jgi:hypothetical protein
VLHGVERPWPSVRFETTCVSYPAAPKVAKPFDIDALTAAVASIASTPQEVPNA